MPWWKQCPAGVCSVRDSTATHWLEPPQWLDDNAAYEAGAGPQRRAVLRRAELWAWARNILLIAMQVEGMRGGRRCQGSCSCRARAACWHWPSLYGPALSRHALPGSALGWRACLGSCPPQPPCLPTPEPLQAVLQLPSVLCLLWFSASLKAGNILFLEEASWASILASPTSVYFFIYAGGWVGGWVGGRALTLGQQNILGEGCVGGGGRGRPRSADLTAGPNPAPTDGSTLFVAGEQRAFRRRSPPTSALLPGRWPAGSAVACQALGFLVPPLLYMRLAASMLAASSLFLLWSLYVPQVGRTGRVGNSCMCELCSREACCTLRQGDPGQTTCLLSCHHSLKDNRRPAHLHRAPCRAGCWRALPADQHHRRSVEPHPVLHLHRP